MGFYIFFFFLPGFIGFWCFFLGFCSVFTRFYSLVGFFRALFGFYQVFLLGGGFGWVFYNPVLRTSGVFFFFLNFWPFFGPLKVFFFFFPSSTLRPRIRAKGAHGRRHPSLGAKEAADADAFFFCFV